MYKACVTKRRFCIAGYQLRRLLHCVTIHAPPHHAGAPLKIRQTVERHPAERRNLQAVYDRDHMDSNVTPAEWRMLASASPLLGCVPATLRRAAWHRDIAAGVALFRLGAKPQSMFYVIAGEVRMVRRSKRGAEIVLQRACCAFLARASVRPRTTVMALLRRIVVFCSFRPPPSALRLMTMLHSDQHGRSTLRPR